MLPLWELIIALTIGCVLGAAVAGFITFILMRRASRK